MARARNIKPAFFANDDLADIAPLGRLLFIGLWTVADREGRLEDRPRRIKAEVLPYDDCDIDSLLNDLMSHGFITRYVADGSAYIQVLNFTKHQNPHVKETASTIPAPDLHGASTDIAGQAPKTIEGASTDKESASPKLEAVRANKQAADASGAPERDAKKAIKSDSCNEHDTSTVQAQCEEQPKPERAGLIPDSGFPLTDSGYQREAAPESPPAAQSGRTPRASRLPEDWSLPKKWMAWALGERPDWTESHAYRVAESFRDYWIGKGGADARKVSWEATWRNWVRREKQVAPQAAAHSSNSFAQKDDHGFGQLSSRL